MTRALLLLVTLTLAACETGSGGSTVPTPATATSATAAPQGNPAVCQNLTRTAVNQLNSPPPMQIDVSKAYTARVNTSRGSFTIALRPKQAPATVNNFVCLGQAHYYDKLTFHRVEPGFVVQGGDPLGNGTGGPNYKLPNETNPAPWKTASVAMASSKAGVSGSQFFVLLGDAPFLATSGVYNQFGNVTEGFDVVQKIQKGDTITSIDIAVQ